MSDGFDTLQVRIEKRAYPIAGSPEDYRELARSLGEARLVLLGEASHGTKEFYQARASISQLLIEDYGFTALAVESDWPDAYRVNRYVQGETRDAGASQALEGFQRFPTWMWRNTSVVEFVEWLRQYNQRLPEGTSKVGFYGLDLYSLHASIEAVINYLEKADPEAAQRARYRYSCFEHFGEDPQAYGYAASFNLTETCEREAVAELKELQQKAFETARQDGFLGNDAYFFVEQNARVVRNAEEYYRSMFSDDTLSWNLRDRHMAETIEALLKHLDSQGKPAKIIVWEHNSHIGDARATDVSRHGELNVGQLVRQRHGDDAWLVGFTTYSGTVSAASDWGAAVERKQVRPALPGSFEYLFHFTEMPKFYLLLRGMQENLSDLNQERLERAIGVVYRPQSERISHYFSARLMDQFDAVVHFDQTEAVEPLERTETWEKGEVPETFPSGV